MLRRAAYFVTFLAILIAVIVGIERTSSPFFQSCISENKNSADKTAAKENPAAFGAIIAIYVRCSGRFIDRHDASIAALGTIIIAAFTFTLWQSTEKLWQASKDQLEHTKTETLSAAFRRLKEEARLNEQTNIAIQSVQAAQASNEIVREAAERQLRAYVFVSEAKFEMAPDGRWAILVTLKNSGQTPAYDVNVTIERDFSPPKNEAIVFPLTDDASIFPAFAFGAQSPHSVHLPCDPPLEIPRGLEGWHAISQSDLRAYLWGRINYVTFEKPQWTTFQMVSYFANVTNFSFCSAGNESSRQ